MNKRAFVAMTGAAILTAALSSGCQDAGSVRPPVAQHPAAQRPAGDAAPARIVADEPESYSATWRLTAETTGEGAAALPRLEADVARRGRDRRVSFRLPDGAQVIYLSRGGTSYVLLPGRGQYAEMSPRGEGFELSRLLMPAGLIDYLKGQGAYVRAGEEELNGRAVVKYVAAGEARAGDVTGANVVYVDKLTELPLRAELISEAGDDVQGVRGVKVVTELRDVRVGADPELFAVPRRMRKVEPEGMRRQVEDVVNRAARIAGPLLGQIRSAEAETAAPAGR